MIYFIFISFGAMIATFLTKENYSKYNSYHSGYELKKELRNIVIYEYDIVNINIELVEEYIFRDYVYYYEIISGYTREVALRKALDKYIHIFNLSKN